MLVCLRQPLKLLKRFLLKRKHFSKEGIKMKKIIVFTFTALTLLGASIHANAHGGKGGYRGGWNASPLTHFAIGALTGVLVTNAYYRPEPTYYGIQSYYSTPQQVAAYCPENGLYYPQTQVCPSGWRKVTY